MDHRNHTENYDFLPYYKAQAGSGIANGHAGDRFHVGNGIWGTVLSYLPSALKYITRFGLSGLKTFGNDVINGKPLSEAGNNALTETAQNVINDANEKLRKFKTMRGKGIKRKTKPRAKSSRKKTSQHPVKRRKLYKADATLGNYI